MRPGCSEPHPPWLECFQGWGIYCFSGQPVPVFYHRLCKKLLISNLSWFSISLKASLFVLLMRALVKCPSPAFRPPLDTGTCYKVSLKPSPGRTTPIFSMSSSERCSSPLIIFMCLLWPLSNSSTALINTFFYWRLRTGFSTVLSKGKQSLLLSTVYCFVDTVQKTFSLHCNSESLLAQSPLVPTNPFQQRFFPGSLFLWSVWVPQSGSSALELVVCTP